VKHPIDIRLATVSGQQLVAVNDGAAPARFAHHQRRNPPFFNGRVWLGIAYVPKPMPVEREAQRLQRALLDPRTAQAIPRWRRVFNFFGRVLS
jgi:hypothetical protein